MSPAEARTNDAESLWTIEDVASFCRVAVSVVRYWVRSSDIPYIKLGRQRRFDPEDIKLWIEERKEGSNARRNGDFRRIT